MQPEAVLHKLTQRIREEFEDLPGLTLTASEAAQFWDLDEMTCELVMGRLYAAGFLVRDQARRYRQWTSRERHEARPGA
jgi:hypothetical protein